MGFWKDVGNNFKRSFIKVFTNPGKANFGEYLTVGGTLATVSSLGYSTYLGAQAGKQFGLQAAAGTLPSQAATPAVTAAVGTWPGAVAGPGEALYAAPGSGVLASTGPLTVAPAAPGAGTVLAPGAGASPGLLATAAAKTVAAGKAVGGFITKAALVSAAAKGVMSPWERAVESIRELGGGGSSGGGVGVEGPDISLSTGGVPGAAASPGAAPIQAAAGSALMVGALVALAGGLLWVYHKRGRR